MVGICISLENKHLLARKITQVGSEAGALVDPTKHVLLGGCYLGGPLYGKLSSHKEKL